MPWSWPCEPWSSVCSASWSCEIIISWLQIGPHTHSEWRRAMDHCLTLLCSRQPIPYYSYFYIPPITLILLIHTRFIYYCYFTGPCQFLTTHTTILHYYIPPIILILLNTTCETHTTYPYQIFLLLLLHRAQPILYYSHYYSPPITDIPTIITTGLRSISYLRSP